jgi:hypothetical protein
MPAWSGRLTKAGAMGLEARVLLFNASPVFNSATPYLNDATHEANTEHLTWHGSYDINRWKLAADAAHALITQVEAGSVYKLHSTGGTAYRKDFQDGYLMRGSEEHLISTRKIYNASTGYTFYTSDYDWGAGCPTKEYADMFPMAANGLPIDNSLGASGYDPAYPFFNAAGVATRDPRLYESILVPTDNYRGRKADTYIGGQDRSSQSLLGVHTGFQVRKFMLDRDNNTSLGHPVQWPYLRLPEIYLIYAEADNEFNGGPSAEGYRCVNLVRSRVGLPNLTPGLNQVQFREAVLTERACEFGVEEIRWFDMIRWKREADFTKVLHGLDCFRSASTPYTYTWTPSVVGNRFWAKPGNWSPKWFLSAWPLNEVQKGYGLIQNPGWE